MTQRSPGRFSAGYVFNPDNPRLREEERLRREEIDRHLAEARAEIAKLKGG